MRFGVIAAEQFRTTEFERVMAADDGEIVGELVAAQDRFVGNKNVGSKIVNETGNLQSHLAGLVGNHVKAVVIPLHPSFVRDGRSELVIPGALEGVVIGHESNCPRKTRSEIARPGIAPGHDHTCR